MRGLRSSELPVIALLSGLIWWCILLWVIHHLSFQLVGIFRHDSLPTTARKHRPSIAILYTTCDDFSVECCESCLSQDYSNYRVLILDDSTSQKYQRLVHDFSIANRPKCERVTRPNGEGFKAGNLNHALDHIVDEEWVLLVDADQILPPNYLSTLVSQLPDDDSGIAFLQTANIHTPIKASSYFQRVLSVSVPLYFYRDLATRERFGFVPLLGHSAVIRKSTWKSVGRFPHLVSEDYAFAMRAASEGRSGVFIREPFAMECVPYDFGGFMVRLRKYASGTAELFRRELGPFLRGRAQVVEKWDALFQLGWYCLIPLATLNGFLSAYVLHVLWKEGHPRYPHPILPFLYVLVPVIVLGVYASAAGGILRTVRFYFWSISIQLAAMPLAGWSFVWHLVSGKATFNRTPKNGESQRLKVEDCAMMAVLGLGAIVMAAVWGSPFSAMLLGQGIAYLSYGIYGELSSPSILGRVSRGVIIYLPGILMLVGLCVMWKAAASAG